MTKCPECRQEIKKPRSMPQHNRFFKLVDIAFHNWPESHEFQPINPEHLRAWLLCKTRYCNVESVEYFYDDPIIRRMALLTTKAVLSATGKSDQHSFVELRGNKISIYSPRSMRIDKLSHKQFQPISTAVDEIVEGIFAMSTDMLLEEHGRAA